MTIPDFAALRTLVDAVDRRRATTAGLHAHIGACGDCQTGRASAPCGAMELYARLQSAMTEMDVALPAAQAALERLEEDFATLHADETGHLHRCLRLRGVEPPRWACAEGCAVQRTEKAQAQSARDVAYWRRRAEGAEQMSAQQEIRLARADGALADAETVATGDVERGIRMLTGERNLLRARLARLEEAAHAPRAIMEGRDD